MCSRNFHKLQWLAACRSWGSAFFVGSLGQQVGNTGAIMWIIRGKNSINSALSNCTFWLGLLAIIILFWGCTWIPRGALSLTHCLHITKHDIFTVPYPLFGGFGHFLGRPGQLWLIILLRTLLVSTS